MPFVVPLWETEQYVVQYHVGKHVVQFGSLNKV